LFFGGSLSFPDFTPQCCWPLEKLSSVHHTPQPFTRFFSRLKIRGHLFTPTPPTAWLTTPSSSLQPFPFKSEGFPRIFISFSIIFCQHWLETLREVIKSEVFCLSEFFSDCLASFSIQGDPPCLSVCLLSLPSGYRIEANTSLCIQTFFFRFIPFLHQSLPPQFTPPQKQSLDKSPPLRCIYSISYQTAPHLVSDLGPPLFFEDCTYISSSSLTHFFMNGSAFSSRGVRPPAKSFPLTQAVILYTILLYSTPLAPRPGPIYPFFFAQI